MTKKVLALMVGICLLGPGSVVSAKVEIIDRVVAIVNDDIITLSQLRKASLPYREQIAQSDKPEEVKKEMIASLELDILHKMIDRTLTRQEAARHQISVSDTDIQTAIDNFKQKNNLDQEGLEKGLEAEGITMEEYRERIKEDILQSMLINRAVRSKVIVSQADIKAYYDAHPEKFKGEKKYHLRNILLKAEEDSQKVLARLDRGLSFQEAARQFSVASNAKEGGDLGVFDIDNFSDAIKDAVLPLKKGEYSRVIPTGQGYQILYVEDILIAGEKSFDEAKEEIVDILYREQAEQKFSRWIESLKENAHVKIML
ncbi:MAG: SurA N-terminal domain-containing protein [Desulfotignum sp.]|nr:SurA N-terminal domain-containing protein [Desulfotignum sp.]